MRAPRPSTPVTPTPVSVPAVAPVAAKNVADTPTPTPKPEQEPAAPRLPRSSSDAPTLIATGMNVATAVLTEQNGVLDYFRAIQKRGVQLAWGSNIGMNWPNDAASRESAEQRTRADHPELQVKFYDGPKSAFENGLGFHHIDMTGKTMWCHEYVSTGPVHDQVARFHTAR